MLKGIFGRLGRKPSQVKYAEEWYSQIMTIARTPEPYAAGWVSDTLEGRFAMVSLISTLVLRELREIGPEGRALADGVYKEVFSGFDYALREEGVGDSSIARKIRKMGEEFFGLARAIDAALVAQNEALLAEALTRNGVTTTAHAGTLSAWTAHHAAELSKLDPGQLLSAQIGWRKNT